jgi:spore maturation protein CgeB
MKIIVVGPQFPDSFARNVVVTLEGMGHQVLNVRTSRAYHHQNRLAHAFWSYLPLLVPAVEQAYYKQLIRMVIQSQPDLLLLTYGIPPQILKEIRDMSSAKVACWFTDPISNIYRGYLVAGFYDALFVKEPFIVPTLRNKLGLNAYYLPEACNPLWHKPVALTQDDLHEFGCDVAGVGTLHYYRARMFEALMDYDLKIWGSNCPPWLHSAARSRYRNKFVAEASKARAFRAAKIVVNTMNYTEIEGVNCSLFEIAGCGGFQITDSKASLAELFTPGVELVTFDSREDLRDKISYYLAHPQEREEIRERGFRRAHRDHTYEQRLTKLLAIVGLGNEGNRHEM